MSIKKIIPLLAIFIGSTSAFSQSEFVDSLVSILPQLEGAEKVKTLGDLCWETGFYDTELALKYGTEALILAQEIGDSALVASSANDLATVQYRISNYDEALKLNHRALAIRKSLGDSLGMASSYSKIGVVFTDQTVLDSGMIYQLKALELFESLGQSAYVGLTYNNLANILEKENQIEDAIEYAEKAYNIFQSIQNPYGEAGACGNLAMFYESLEDYEQSLDWAMKSMELFEAVGSVLDVANVSNNIGFYYRKLGDIEKGREYYQKAYDLSVEIGNKHGIAQYQANLASIHADQKEYSTAEILYRDALDMALEEDIHSVILQCYQGLSTSLEGQGKFQDASEFLKSYVAKKDSVYSEEQFKIVSELEVRYNNERSERLLAEEKANNSEQARKLQKQRFINYAAFGGFAVVIILVILFISRQRAKQRAEMSETRAIHNEEMVKERENGLKAVFRAIEEERQRIAKDLHDGLGSQLSGLKLSLSNLASDSQISGAPAESLSKIVGIVDTAAHDIRSISHQMMPKALKELGLVAAINDLLDKSFSMSDIAYRFEHFKVEGKRYSESVELGVFRICQELVNNVIKHSNAKAISVQLFENAGQLILVVEDDGVGFDAQKHRDGIGLMNIESRLKTIGGEAHWSLSPEGGTIAAVRVAI